MSVPTLTPVSTWPTRKLPQATFDTGVRTSMNQMSTMVGELNSGVIPGINAVAADVDLVVANLAAIQAAQTNAVKTLLHLQLLRLAVRRVRLTPAASAAASAAAAAAVTGLPSHLQGMIARCFPLPAGLWRGPSGTGQYRSRRTRSLLERVTMQPDTSFPPQSAVQPRLA